MATQEENLLALTQSLGDDYQAIMAAVAAGAYDGPKIFVQLADPGAVPDGSLWIW